MPVVGKPCSFLLVRIGLLGQLGEDTSPLGDMVRHCVADLQTDTLFYLGTEPETLALISERRRELESDTSTKALWRRSESCLSANADEIEEFVSAHRRVRAWAQIEVLGASGRRRLLSARGRSWLLCAKDNLLEEGEASDAELIAHGHRAEPLIDVAGGQVLVAPGALSAGGLMVLDDDDGLAVRSYDSGCRLLAEEHIALSQLPPRVAHSASA